MQVLEHVVITTDFLPKAKLSVPYSEMLMAQKGKAPYSWSIVSGQLPNGLSLDRATGMITGTPTEFGKFKVTFEVTDSLGGTAELTIKLKVKG